MSEVAEQGIMKTRKGYKKSKISELDGLQMRAKKSQWEENTVELTVDCLLEIFKYLSVLDRIRIERVNKAWYEASHLSLFSLKSWKIKCRESEIVFEELKTNSRIKADHESRAFEELLLRFSEFVTELYVSNVKNDSQIMIILSTCRNLVKVHISHMCLDKVRFLLWKLEKLNELSLDTMKGIGKDGCLELVLSRLRLTSFYIDNGLEISDGFFKSLPSDIKSLGIADCKFRNKRSAFNMLANFKNLRSLALSWHTLPKEVEPFIDLMKKLNIKKLNISWNFEVVDDDFLIELAKHADSLTELNISGNQNVTDRGLNAVTNLPNLEILAIEELYDINGNVDVNLPNLKCLRCRGSNLSEEALIKFLNASYKLEVMVLEIIDEKFIRAAGKVAQARKSQIPIKIVIYSYDKDIIKNFSAEDMRQLKIVTDDCILHQQLNF